MRTLTTFLVITFLLNVNLFSQEKFQYISPVKNSSLVSLSSTIILGAKNKIDFLTVDASKIIVTGNKSGIHKGKVKLSDDKKTLIFVPAKQFEPNEKVSVNISSGIRTIKGENLGPVSYQFTTTPLSKPIVLNPLSTISDKLQATDLMNKNSGSSIKKVGSNLATGSLPSDFPEVTIDSVDNPAPGKIFMANFLIGPPDSLGRFLMILNNDGSVVKYKRLDFPSFDFKVQPNGYLSYADVIEMNGGAGTARWIVMDTTFAPVDTFQCGNGYEADIHEFRLLTNGHGLLFAYDPEPIDMSLVVDGGDPNATVIGTILQEVDADNNVIFQWRSWDYIPITESYANLTAATIDYMHANAADVDLDGNYLLCARTLSQIIKIDRATGDVIWKLGGKSNDFQFINETEANAPTYFSFQHNVTVLPNGNITLFDNGTQHSPSYSRGVEYHLDEESKTAEMVWEYRHSPDINTFAMGTVQRLPNGNTLIGWGSNGAPALTEVHPDNSVAFELSLPAGETSYRSFRFPWLSGTSTASVTQEILEGNTYTFDYNTDTTGIKIKFSPLDGSIYTFATVTRYNYASINPTFTTTAPLMAANYFTIEGSGIVSYTGKVNVNLKYYPAVINPKETIVYARSGSNSNFFALPTSYDSTNNELTFTTSTLGDFAFGMPQIVDSAYAPVPIEPPDEEIVNVEDTVKLMWGTRGIVSDYSLQIASDSQFSNLIVDETLSSTSYKIGGLTNNSEYFWRVSSTNSSGESEWSAANSFITSSPYVTVTYPNGNDSLYADSTYIIRWDDNLSGKVRIDLIKNDVVVSNIVDSLVSVTNAYLWNVSSSQGKDSTYKIKVTNIDNEDLFDLSDNTFVISGGVVDVSEPRGAAKEYKLLQNYPNPFNPSTVIEYALPVESKVTISIFNVIGQQVAVLVNGIQNAGNHSVKWNAQNLASGIYFYQIRAVSPNREKDFTSFKKAILIK